MPTVVGCSQGSVSRNASEGWTGGFELSFIPLEKLVRRFGLLTKILQEGGYRQCTAY